MDILSWLLSRKYTDNSILGIAGALSGKNCTIESAQKVGSDTTIVFKWTADNGTVRRTSIVVTDGDTPAISSTPIAHGHKLTFTTSNPTQSVTFDVLNGNDGAQGVSVVGADVDNNNYLKLTLSNGNVINAGQIKAVTNVDPTLSPTSSNPVENKVITAALDTKVDKEAGKGLFSDEEKTKLANIEDGAQVNVLEKLIINGQEATITDKSIALTIITSAVSNLQNYYLKSETYTKQEVEDLIGSTVGVTIEIVEQLPTEGQSNVIYFLPTETEDVYSQYIYTADGWILIGSTTVDLSNYYTKTQVDTLLNGKQNVLTIDAFPTALSNNPVASGGVYTAIARMQPQFQFANMPTASASNLGFVYQYTGATGTYTQDMFYRCVYDSELGEYKWVEVIFHATVTVDSAISGTSTNPVQNKVIKEALDTKQDIMQYSTMPSAQDNLGKIVQYTGTNTANYTNGYFYKAIYDSASDVYVWTVIKFSADMLVDNALSTTSENPVQNKVITGAINNIQGVIPSEASSTNQLVDRDSLGTASQKNFTPYVSPDNTDVPLSSSVYSAITSAVYGAYHPSGSKTIAELTSDLLVFANIGNVYKITEDGVTTNLFIGGAGQTIHTGDNAVVVYGGQPDTFLFDLQSGSIDLEPYQTKALGSAIEGETTVEGALGALSTNKQAKTLETSVESQTTVEGALGALSTNKATQAEVNDIVNVLGAKNLIPYPYHRQNGYTTNGATFTYDDEGVITVNKVVGNSTAYFALFSNVLYPDAEKFLEPNTSYILSMELENASDTSCFVQVQNGSDIAAIRNKATGKYEISFTTTETVDGLAVALYYGAEKTENNAKVKLMIRLASIQDDTYVPYAPTNAKLNEEKMSYADNGILGAKNVLKNNIISTTRNGVTYTPNSDGTFIANGTATANGGIQLNANIDASLIEGVRYKVSLDGIGADKDGTQNGIMLYVAKILNGANIGDVARSNKTGGFTDEFVYHKDSSFDNLYVGCYIFKNASFTNSTIKPMIRLASDSDDTYQPYAMTNQQLTKDTTALLDNVEVNGAVNMLPNTATTQTLGDGHVTFTVNNDGTVTATADGQQTSNVELPLYTNSDGSPHLVGKTVKLSGCPSSGSTSTYSIQAYRVGAVDGSTGTSTDNGDGIEFTWLNNGSGTKAVVKIIIRPSYSGTVTFKPMLTVPSYNGDYVPYAKSNKELTEDVDTINNNGFLQANSYCFYCSANSSAIDAYAQSLGITTSTTFSEVINILKNNIRYNATRFTVSTNDANLSSSASQLLKDLCGFFGITACAVLSFDVKVIDTYNQRVEIMLTDKNLNNIKIVRVTNGTAGTVKTIALS